MWLYKRLCPWLSLDKVSFTVYTIKCRNIYICTHPCEHYSKLPDCVNLLSVRVPGQRFDSNQTRIESPSHSHAEEAACDAWNQKHSLSVCSTPPSFTFFNVKFFWKLNNSRFQLSVLFITAAKKGAFSVWNETSKCSYFLSAAIRRATIYARWLNIPLVFSGRWKVKYKQECGWGGTVGADNGVSCHFPLLCLADRESSADSLILPAEWTTQPYWGHIWQPFSCQIFLYSSLALC